MTFQANIEFERKKGVLKVGSPLEGLKAKLEIDFLESEDRPTPHDLDAIQKEVKEFDYVKWDKAHIEATLCSLSNCISTQCIYDPCLSRENTTTANPVISFAPILILRKRTTRTLVDYYRQIIEQIETSTTVPSGVKNLVEDIVESPTQHENYDRVGRNDLEIYFPLPSNEEQKKIIQAVEKSDAVLVKGPPGTGKSHTIANLMAHFLAEGKRVLVTSQTPRALQVLKNKLPDELQPLCVVWLGSDPESFKALENSVSRILQKTDIWDREQANLDIEDSSQRLIETRGTIAKTQKDLISIRESDSYQHRDICGCYSGTLQEIAIAINNDANDYEWFLDQPNIDDACPLSINELQWHRNLHTKLNNNIIEEFRKTHFDIGKLHAPAEFADYVLKEKQARNKMETLESARQYTGYETLKSLDTNTSMRLRELIIAILGRIEELSKHYHVWANKAVLDIAADQDRSWRVLLEET